MSEARAVVLSLLVLLGAFAVVAPAPLAMPAQSPSAPAAVPLANETSMGGQVSSFIHASSGQASEEVESGMWNAAFETASNKTAIVDSRAADIATRLAEVKEQKRQLTEAKENGSITRTEYESRMSAIVGRMAALNRSIDETERQARASGANLTRVERLRKEASNMAGPEVAAMAKSLAGGPPEGVPAGQPDHAGTPNGSDGSGNNGQGPPGNETGNGGGQGNDGGQGNGGGSD